MDTSRGIGSRILVPLDGSALAALALPQAAAIAAPSASVTLLRVVVPSPDADAGSGDGDPLEIVAATARQELEDAAGRLYAIAPNLNVDVVVRVGQPGAEIARFADHDAIDLIVMASFGQGGIRHWTFGTVAGHVVRHARVPVLIVRPQDAASDESDAFQRILVPLDGSLRAEQSLPIARALAHRLDVAVHLVCVIDPERAGFPGNGIGPNDPVWRDIRTALHGEAQETLRQAAAALARHGVTATWDVRQGPTVPCIRETTQPGDLMVLTSHARSSPPQWPEGSVGEQLVRTAGIPIVLSRFVSPPDIAIPVSAEAEPIARVFRADGC